MRRYTLEEDSCVSPSTLEHIQSAGGDVDDLIVFSCPKHEQKFTRKQNQHQKAHDAWK